MILGVGIDIIEVDRVRHSFERFGERFLRRIFCPDEVAYCLKHRDPAPFLAARFAAKEAASKAFGTGIGSVVGWHDLEVRRMDSGQPYLILHGPAQELFTQRGGRATHLSLSHTEAHATAVAILDG